jgi:nucleotide-binding universal stress UspA family protein
MKLLLALNPSDSNEAAITEVALRPWPIDTTLEVLSVVDIPELLAVPVVIAEATKQAEGVVLAAGKRLESSGLKPTLRVLLGDAKAVIVDRAKERGVDLIVVGAHRGVDAGPFLIGSVAKGVVHFAPCSVEVARAGKWSPATGSNMRVLLAVDGSEGGMAAARSVAERSWPDGTEVRVLSVVEFELPMIQSVFEPPYLPVQLLEALRVDATKRSEEAVTAAVQLISRSGLKTSESVAASLASSKQVILDEARQWNADLIVLGSHGRKGISRFLLGSVSEAVAMHARCSVDIIRGHSGEHF